MKIICLISHPRSGSTSLMKNIERETNSAAVLEIFHPLEKVICQHLDEGLGKGTSEIIKKSLGIDEIKKFALENPVKYINKLKEQALSKNKNSLIFKVFPGHITDRDKLKDVISISDRLFILRRNTLQSYISNKKAIQVGTYANVDTSDVKVNFNCEDFMEWRKNIYSFFYNVELLSTELKIKLNIFNYEELFSNGDSSQIKLFNFLELETGKTPKTSTPMKKQDHNTTAVDKVNNDSKMMDFLKGKGWEKMNSVKSIDIIDK